jgi:hypothetical protein
MNRFKDLLTPGQGSTPKDEQQRASAGLADALSGSNLRRWEGRGALPVQGKCLLLAVAPYSQYDLTLLDVLDESLDSGRSPAIPVYVANLLDYDRVEQVRADFPGIAQAHQTPLAALWESGTPKKIAWGKQARDLAAEALGLDPEVLSRRVAAESPSYANRPGH